MYDSPLDLKGFLGNFTYLSLQIFLKDINANIFSSEPVNGNANQAPLMQS